MTDASVVASLVAPRLEAEVAFLVLRRISDAIESLHDEGIAHFLEKFALVREA